MTNKNINIGGKRLLICEEALVDFKGHFYSWIKAIRSIHLDAGAEVMVASNKQVRKEIDREFNCFKVYTQNSWSDTYNSRPAVVRYLNVLIHNLRLIIQNLRLLQKTKKVDCVILTAARIYHLIGWRILCSIKMKRGFDRLIIFIPTSEAHYSDDYKTFRFNKSSVLIKLILKSYKKYVITGKVIFAGDSPITCAEYEALASVPFRVFPSPAAGLTATVHNKQLFDSDVCTFVLLGVSSMEKGIDILQRAIIKILSEDPTIKARFIVQWANLFNDYEGNRVLISDFLRQSDKVLIIEKVLNDSEYSEYMKRADFLILPYRRNIYFNRISGVAIEGACSGIPMIVTKNTWLEMAMNEFGAGLSFEDGDVVDLVDKIKDAADLKMHYSRLALGRRKIANEINSPTAYLDCVWN